MGGGGGYNSTYEYDRRKATLRYRIGDSSYSGLWERHYLYHGVTDSTLHALVAQGKLFEEAESVGLGVRRQVILEEHRTVKK